jgi:hypothetical protein
MPIECATMHSKNALIEVLDCEMLHMPRCEWLNMDRSNWRIFAATSKGIITSLQKPSASNAFTMLLSQHMWRRIAFM